MTVIKTKTKKGFGNVTLEHVTMNDLQKPGVTYTGYVVKRNGETVSAMRSNKKDAMSFFVRECARAFGPTTIKG